ncbi:hypothetical protein V6R21_07585 [Limibacter armeniacum]|uniref:hypothetical protein n=1 Tax=Limibacter armeniacum TaxID=466084 RepID=UPI002FE5C501
MNELEEQACYNYEAFMTRAFRKRYDGSNLKLDMSTMRNLIWSEQGESAAKILKPTPVLFANVKKNLLQAADKFLKFNLTDKERAIIEEERQQIDLATDSAGLIRSINRVVDITDQFRLN